MKTGYRQLSDDILALTEAGHALSFPTAIGIKPGAMALPESRTLIAQSPGKSSIRDHVCYVQAPSFAPAGSDFAVSAIVFPSFDPEAKDELRPLYPAEALVELIHSGTQVSPSLNSILPLVRLLNETPIYQMSYANSRDALRMTRSLLEPSTC